MVGLRKAYQELQFGMDVRMNTDPARAAGLQMEFTKDLSLRYTIPTTGLDTPTTDHR